MDGSREVVVTATARMRPPLRWPADEGMGLAGWTAYAIGPGKSAKTGHASLRFQAAKLPGPFATVKELRAAAAKGS